MMVQRVAGSNPSMGQPVNQAVNGTFFRISKRRQMSFTFHVLCPSYSGPQAPTAPTANGLWETLPPPITVKNKRCLGSKSGPTTPAALCMLQLRR